MNDQDGDKVTITIDSVYSDERFETKKGKLVPDALIVGENHVNLRAKREGAGNGRVYVINFTANSDGGTCHGTVKVGVPHDQARAPVEDSPLYPATVSLL